MTLASANIPRIFFRLILLRGLIWGQGFGKVPEVIFFFLLFRSALYKTLLLLVI